jgi:diketogulonate reductase-like aldo/keto reductase
MIVGMPEIPAITLSNGVAMPCLGFGLYKQSDRHGSAVSAALEAGYRSFDSASIYGNEPAVGKALEATGVPRHELFVTGKVWNGDQGHRRTIQAFERSLDDLRLDHLDLYLIHYPAPSRDRYVETWLALEELLTSGRVRAIGVANFEPEHLRRILGAGTVAPAVNQVELHPLLPQSRLRALHAEHGIVTEAHTPLARGNLVASPALAAVAAKHGRTPAQVALRWHVQQGHVAIPKSATPARIRQNIDVFGFALDAGDVARIAAMETGERFAPRPDAVN